VSYATSVKVAVLGVPQDVVDRVGVISAECAVAMADGAARITGADFALATTGVAGPDRQEDHPGGTVFLGLHTPTGTTPVPLQLSGDRAEIQRATCAAALTALLDVLRPSDPGALVHRPTRP
jgi:nicotinamide-nucleotide amidase